MQCIKSISTNIRITRGSGKNTLRPLIANDKQEGSFLHQSIMLWNQGSLKTLRS